MAFFRSNSIRFLVCIMLVLCVFWASLPVVVTATHLETWQYDEQKLVDIIDGVFDWYKRQSNSSILLSDEFLKMAGTTPGDWMPISLGRYGLYQGEDYSRYLNAITDYVIHKYAVDGKLDSNKATEWHRISLALLAMGGDPQHVGVPYGKNIDLIADGTYNCMISKGPGIATQGLNGPIWGLLSLSSKDYNVPANAKYQIDDLIALIMARQLDDGGFSLAGKPSLSTFSQIEFNNDVPVMALRDNLQGTGSSRSDPDITGMAIQALAPYYYTNTKKYTTANGKKTVQQVVNEALTCMSKRQTNDGDFISWGTQNSESTVQMLVALCSLGIDPDTDERFIKNGKTLMDGLMKYYNAKDGGFIHAFVEDPDNPTFLPGETNGMATEQCLYGLISYWRLKKNMRSLYDFRPETDQDAFCFDVGGAKYAIPIQPKISSYVLRIPPGTQEVKLTNIPMGPYDSSNIAVGSIVQLASPLTVTLSGRAGDSKATYTIEFKEDETAVIAAIIAGIDLLPDTISLENLGDIEMLRQRVDTLDINNKKLITNLQKLINAEKRIAELKQEAGKLLEQKKTKLLIEYKALPTVLSLDNKAQVERLWSELKALGSSDTAVASAIAVLDGYKTMLAQRQALATKLGNDIWAAIEPTKPPTITDSPIITALLTRYRALTERDRAYVKTTAGVAVAQDLIWADEIIRSLGNGIIPKAVFTAITGSNGTYSVDSTISGNSNVYKITFSGKDITSAFDFNYKVSSFSTHISKIKKIASDATVLSFSHKGALPGKATVDMSTTLSSGTYMLYSYNEDDDKAEFIQRVTVSDKKLSFMIRHGSDYFLTKHATSTPHTVKKHTSDITAYTDMIPKKAFEQIKGKNINIKVIGKTSVGTHTFIFNGTDVTAPADFKAGVSFLSTYNKEIEEIAENPLPINFEHFGTFPGKALLEIKTNLADGDYLLFRYNSRAKKAEVVQKITVSIGSTKFITDGGTDLFIAKRAIAGGIAGAQQIEKKSLIPFKSGRTNIYSPIGTAASFTHEDLEELLSEYETRKQSEKGEDIMPVTLAETGQFTADQVVKLLGLALDLRNNLRWVDLLVPVAILLGAVMICICILYVGRTRESAEEKEKRKKNRQKKLRTLFGSNKQENAASQVLQKSALDTEPITELVFVEADTQEGAKP